MNKIKCILRKWLGIDDLLKSLNLQYANLDKLRVLHNDLVSIGVDVHFKEPHMILIYSKLKGGQIRHLEGHFENIKELEDFVRELKSRFQTNRVIWDRPQALREMDWRGI